MKLFSTIKLLAFFALASAWFVPSHAQTTTMLPNYWTTAQEDALKSSVTERRIIPKAYKVFSLDLKALRSALEETPVRFSKAAEKKEVVLALPRPDGQFESFRLFKTNLLPPELEAKFPMIQTFTGRGIDDPSAILQLDLTYKGLHAMVLHEKEGAYYIDPYGEGTDMHYTVYARKDFATDKTFECHYETVNDLTKASSAEGSEKVIGDCQLRSYQLALACTGEYANYHGGTVMGAMSAMTTSINRVNGIYEQEIGVTFQFVPNNDDLIFLNPNTDPYTNNNGGAMLGQNQTTCDNIIGSANYDIGHVFSTGGGGVAVLSSVCSANSKARGVTGLANPVGDPFDVDYVCHEIGHQFAGRHTQNNDCNRDNNSSYEPGSASTIMGYAGICAPNVQDFSDPYFHVNSVILMRNFSSGLGATCATIENMSNSAPTADAGLDYTIPRSTPFVLTGTGSDGNGDALTYCWEQYDKQFATMPPPSTNTSGPAFRSFLPTPEPERYFPRLADVVNNNTPTWEVLASVTRTYNFQLSVRDNSPLGGCVDDDAMVVSVAGNTGPFLVTAPNTPVSWMGNSTQNVTWEVANTNVAPVGAATVDILLSTDGGFTYPTVLASNVTNDGSHPVTVPNTPTSTARVMVKGHNHIFFDISNTNFTITPGNPPLTVNVEVINVPCFGDQTGTAFAIPMGGTGNYSFLWSTGGTDQTITGLGAGTYSVTVNDGESQVVGMGTIVQPTPLVLMLSGTDAFNGNDGTATVSISGGTPPYSILWSTGETTPTIEGLTPGVYTVAVTDFNNCPAAGEITIGGPGMPLMLSTTVTPISCFGADDGSIAATASGGSGNYVFLWNTGETGPTLSDLGPGTYIVTLDDGVNTLADTVILTEPDSLFLMLSGTDANNGDNGTATVTINGGTPPYTVLWSNGADTTFIQDLAPGIYSVSVTDSSSCVAIDSILIEEVSGGCVAPLVTEINPTTTSALITWDPLANAERYRLRYRLVGAIDWSLAGVLAPGNSLTLQGLMPDSDYEFQLLTRCLDGSTSDWSETLYTFTTDDTPVGPCDSWEPFNTTTTETTATIEIVPVPDAIRYRIQYRVVGTIDWSQSSTTSTTFHLLGLLPGSNYEYNTSTRCPEGWTDWSLETYLFTTLSGPVDDCVSWIPSATTTTSNSATVDFDLQPGADKYRMRYREVGTATWLGAITLSPPMVIEGLAPEVTYEFNTSSRCVEGWTGWSAETYTFTTDMQNLWGKQANSHSLSEMSFTLSPNPASEQIHLLLEKGTGIEVQVSDLNGTVMLTQPFHTPSLTLDIRALPAGMYFISVRGTEGTIQTQRFIKGL